MFGNLPDPSSTNQPAAQRIATLKGGSGITPPDAVAAAVQSAGVPGRCLTYQSPYLACMTSSNVPDVGSANNVTNAAYSCTATQGWQVTITGAFSCKEALPTHESAGSCAGSAGS